MNEVPGAGSPTGFVGALPGRADELLICYAEPRSSLYSSLMVGDAPGGLSLHSGCHLSCVRPFLSAMSFSVGVKVILNGKWGFLSAKLHDFS